MSEAPYCEKRQRYLRNGRCVDCAESSIDAEELEALRELDVAIRSDGVDQCTQARTEAALRKVDAIRAHEQILGSKP